MVDRTLVWLLEKIGESNSKVREMSEEAGVAMAGHPAIGSSVLV